MEGERLSVYKTGDAETIADVTASGAILLGASVSADSCGGRSIRVVTHAHQDHTLMLSKSVRRSLFIVATPTTLRMLTVLGYKVPEYKAIPLEYGRSFMFEEERITLLYARHIAGSAQVVVEGPGYRVGYTGDFKMPGTVPLEDLDVLVLDATYGDPTRQRRWSDWEALLALIGLVEERLRYGPVWVYGYHGKLQEIMVELRKSGVDVPFYADRRTVELARIASEFYRANIGSVGLLHEHVDGEPAILFVHASKRRSYRRRPGTHILLSGWEMRGVIVETGPSSYTVSYSDHATLREIVEYLRQARPKSVIVDAYRGKSAARTAKYIERLLGIRAVSRPVGGRG